MPIAPLLDSFCGKPPGDPDALVEAILAIAWQVEKDAACLVELVVNPLLVRAVRNRVVAVDALIKVEESES